ERTVLTVELIKAVYMGTTPLKRQESGYIRQKIAEEILAFQKLLLDYKNNSLPVDEKQKIKQAISEHLNAASAFTAFKRNIIKRNPELFQCFMDYL
ncbi:MAG: hypothetical protein LBQ77_08610, partial [Treponema sp.]|nr:hypothetical protein [Treponema sp.]